MRISVHQTNTKPDLVQNAEIVRRGIYEAAANGAKLASFPEAVNLLRDNSREYLTDAPLEGECPVLRAAIDAANEACISVHLGSLLLRTGAEKVANRTYFIDDTGELLNTYNKIHLFDVDLPGIEPTRESDVVAAGEDIVVVNTPDANFGLAICFDVRFPALFQALAAAGANVLLVPAAFSPITGKVHWLPLLQARAIETGSYVVAAAQCGNHQGNLSTHGHSVVINPWGEVIAEAGSEPKILFADIDIAKIDEARTRIPTLQLKRVN